MPLLFNFAVVSSLNGLCAGLAEQGAVNCSELEECLGSTRQAKNAKTLDAPAKETHTVENGSAAPLFTLTEETYEDNSIDEQLCPTAGDSNTLEVADECVGILCLTICTSGSQKPFIVLDFIFFSIFKFPLFVGSDGMVLSIACFTNTIVILLTTSTLWALLVRGAHLQQQQRANS